MTQSLLEVSLASLDANIETVGQRRVVTAGRNQFRSAWTRDFCFAAFGLLAHQRSEVVKEHIELLLEMRGQNDFVPRSLDSMSTKLRVVLASLRRVFGRLIPTLRLKAKLKPEFKGEHGTAPIDGNTLLTIAAERYRDTTSDALWWQRHLTQLRELIEVYSDFMEDGLLVQPPFSDWQDSVRREGASFLSNLFLWKARCAVGIDGRALRAKILSSFRNGDGLFRSMLGADQVSLDGNLLAIDLGLLGGDEARALYEKTKAHELWTRAVIPGAVTVPDYPKSDIAWTTRVVGLRHYHDRLAWSWLAGLALRCTRRFGDTAETERISQFLEKVAQRDGMISEVYEPTEGWPIFRRWAYRSEGPFAWGAGMIAYGLSDDHE